VQRCEVTELAVYECAHCRDADSRVRGEPAAKKRETRGRTPAAPRRTKPGNAGRVDGAVLVAARVASNCEVCQLPVGAGDLVVRDDFGHWVHDECCPDTDASATTLPITSPPAAPPPLRAGVQRSKQRARDPASARPPCLRHRERWRSTQTVHAREIPDLGVGRGSWKTGARQQDPSP
jgi:hypothetical protein